MSTHTRKKLETIIAMNYLQFQNSLTKKMYEDGFTIDQIANVLIFTEGYALLISRMGSISDKSPNILTTI